MKTTHQERQRSFIQACVNTYFRKPIEISPRAMAAFQLSASASREGELGSAAVVFQNLLKVSPACLSALYDQGVAVKRLFKRFSVGKDDPLLPPASTLSWVFKGSDPAGTMALSPWDVSARSRKNCRAAVAVSRSGLLTEMDMFLSFLQTGYVGKVHYDRKPDLQIHNHLSDVGDLLADSMGLDAFTYDEDDDEDGRYRASPTVYRAFRALEDRTKKALMADPSHGFFQFALWQDAEGLIRVRPFGVGTVGALEPRFLENGRSYVFRNGIFQPARVVFPGFPEDVLGEFEDLVNSKKAREDDFQSFFETYPQFLAGLDYRRVHPQLVLSDETGPAMIPDFILEPLASEFCDLLELKLPYHKLVRRLRNSRRTRFRQFVNEAVSQLVEYRRFFENKRQRGAFHARYGLKAYCPRMILVVGRRHHFKNDLERQEMQALLPKDLTLWTYDDLIARAKAYRQCVEV